MCVCVSFEVGWSLEVLNSWKYSNYSMCPYERPTTCWRTEIQGESSLNKQKKVWFYTETFNPTSGRETDVSECYLRLCRMDLRLRQRKVCVWLVLWLSSCIWRWREDSSNRRRFFLRKKKIKETQTKTPWVSHTHCTTSNNNEVYK